VPARFKSYRTARFLKLLSALPLDIQEKAQESYNLWQNDPFHPSLHFKQLANGLWSARITADYRVLGQMKGDTVTWLWIGDHREYEKRI
jgi:Txe/YoeB family toxin of Txe-Axe toxin-antitoxin module